MAKMVQSQQVSFKTAAEAKEAQILLLRGLSFADLMKRYPNEEQKFTSLLPRNSYRRLLRLRLAIWFVAM